jgi:membrane-associated phospholipid phosphatase
MAAVPDALDPPVGKITATRAVFSMSIVTTRDASKFQIGQWLLLSDYGEPASRYMVVSWVSVAILALVVSVWLPFSALSLDQAAWWELADFLIYGTAAYAFYLIISHRLRKHEDRIALCLRWALERLALLFRACLLISAIGGAGFVFTYLATAAALPMQDAFLARLDGHLGFHWPSFLAAVNDLPFVPDLLGKAYQSTAALMEGVVLWLTIRGSGERLAEFLALLCLSSLGLAVGMVLLPAAGAFAYFEPAPQLFDHFAGGREMWPFLDAFNSLRDGSLTKIDLSSIQGVVSFPSFHTMLGIITTYALRDTRALLIPAVMLNGTMIVATLPVGGHYLMDTLTGAAISIAAFHWLQYESRRAALPHQSTAAFGLNGASLSGQMPLSQWFLQRVGRLRIHTLGYLFIATAACLVAYVALENLHAHF